MMNKKGGLPDGLYLIVGLFAIAIAFMFGWMLMSNINTNMQDSPAISDFGKELVQKSTDKYVNIVDGAFLYLFIGLIIAILIGAYLIRSHPALFWFSIPVIVFLVFIAAIYANIFQEIGSSAQVTSYLLDFKYMKFIFDNFIYFFVGFIILLSVALFAKNPEYE